MSNKLQTFHHVLPDPALSPLFHHPCTNHCQSQRLYPIRSQPHNLRGSNFDFSLRQIMQHLVHLGYKSSSVAHFVSLRLDVGSKFGGSALGHVGHCLSTLGGIRVLIPPGSHPQPLTQRSPCRLCPADSLHHLEGQSTELSSRADPFQMETLQGQQSEALLQAIPNRGSKT